MKLINKDNTTGGRGLFINDILTVEENFYKHSQAQFQNRGAFIISGVISTADAVSQGVVVIDNEVMSFEGATDVTFPIYLVKETVFLNNFVFQDGATKPLYIENKAVISSTIPAEGEYISISASGGKRYTDVLMQDLMGLKGNQTISGNKTFNNNVIVADINVKNKFDEHDLEIAKKANIAQEAWKNLSMATGAIKMPASSIHQDPISAPQYMKDSLGFVHLRGIVQVQNYQNSLLVATLPAGYRPEFNVHFAGIADKYDKVLQNGQIFSAGATIFLDKVSFRAA